MLSVLIIDDEPALLEVMKLFFDRSGDMTVHTALSAKEALSVLEEKTFDALIVDYNLPEISGLEFLKILRSKGDTTPVIIFTGGGHERWAIEALNNGANFYLQKDEDPQTQFRKLHDMIKITVEGTYAWKKIGTTRKILTDMINFSLDPCFAIDSEGKVVAWNTSLEQLSGTPAGDMIGKGDLLYSIPFFGTRRKMLVNLIFEPDEEITRQKYRIVSRVAKGPVIAVTRGVKKDGTEWTVWSKAMPVYDMQGNFIASVGIVRDVTGTSEDTVKPEDTPDTLENLYEAKSLQIEEPAGLFSKILGRSGKASFYYKEGVNLYSKDRKYDEAIAAFNKALEINDKLPHVWNVRGLCFREKGDTKNALMSLTQAVKLEPENVEFMFNLGETLHQIGVQTMSNEYLNPAIEMFKRVVELMPNNADAWNHIGVCYNEMGQSEESRLYFDRARDIHIWKKHTPIIPEREKLL